MNAIELARNGDPVIKKASKMVWQRETIKRLKQENRFLHDVYKAMNHEYMHLLTEKYRLSELARKLAEKLRRQRDRHKKNYAWLWRKYQQAKRRCKVLEEWKARGYKKLRKTLKNPNEVA